MFNLTSVKNQNKGENYSRGECNSIEPRGDLLIKIKWELIQLKFMNFD